MPSLSIHAQVVPRVSFSEIQFALHHAEIIITFRAPLASLALLTARPAPLQDAQSATLLPQSSTMALVTLLAPRAQVLQGQAVSSVLLAAARAQPQVSVHSARVSFTWLFM